MELFSHQGVLPTGVTHSETVKGMEITIYQGSKPCEEFHAELTFERIAEETLAACAHRQR